MNRSRSLNYWLVLVWVLNLVFLSGWLYLLIMTNQLSDNWQSDQAAKSQNDPSDFINLKHFLDSTTDKQAAVSKLIVTSDTATDFVDRLDILAQGSNVRLKINQALPAATGPGLNLELVVTGSFPAVDRFIEILDNLPEPLVIENLDLSNSQVAADFTVGKTTSSVWQATIKADLVTYKN